MKDNQNQNEDKLLKESRLRSMFKGISWRVIGTLDTMAISWFITGNISFALSIGGIEVITKFILYYGHERLWQVVPRGTIRRIFHKTEI